MITLYKSEKTSVEIDSIDESPSNKLLDQDLIDLANSGLIEDNILNFDKDSFVFQSNNIIMPNFIYDKCLHMKNIIGFIFDRSKLSFELRKSIYVEFNKKLNHPETIEEIKSIIKLNETLKIFRNQAKDSIADYYEEMFNNSLTKLCNTKISIYESDSDEELFFLLDIASNLTVEKVLDGYAEAIAHNNKLFKVSLGSEKLSFCPIDTKLGEELYKLINLINLNLVAINNTLVNYFIEVSEKVLGVDIQDYMFESNKVSGIDIKLNAVFYYKNVTAPCGLVSLTYDRLDPNKIFVGKLHEDIGYLPQDLNPHKHKDKFEEINELRKVADLI